MDHTESKVVDNFWVVEKHYSTVSIVSVIRGDSSKVKYGAIVQICIIHT